LTIWAANLRKCFKRPKDKRQCDGRTEAIDYSAGVRRLSELAALYRLGEMP